METRCFFSEVSAISKELRVGRNAQQAIALFLHLFIPSLGKMISGFQTFCPLHFQAFQQNPLCKDIISHHCHHIISDSRARRTVQQKTQDQVTRPKTGQISLTGQNAEISKAAKTLQHHLTLTGIRALRHPAFISCNSNSLPTYLVPAPT